MVKKNSKFGWRKGQEINPFAKIKLFVVIFFPVIFVFTPVIIKVFLLRNNGTNKQTNKAKQNKTKQN